MDMTHTEVIQQLYVAFLGRPGDPAGLQYWTEALDHGTPLASIREAFAQSGEFKGLMAGKSTAHQVNQLYHNLLGRDADLNGLSYYTAMLDQHKGTFGNVVADLIAGASGSDPETIYDKVLSAELFTTALGVNPASVAAYAKDTSKGVAYLEIVADDLSFYKSLESLADLLEGRATLLTARAADGASFADPTEALVQQLYLAYFKRPADVFGLSNFTHALESTSPEQVGRIFTQSEPFRESTKGLGHTEVVDRLYMNLFGRHADSEGLKFFGGALASGQASVEQVVLGMISGAQQQDREVLENRTIAAELFTTAMKASEAMTNAYSARTQPGADYIDPVGSDASVYGALRGLWDVYQEMVTATGVPPAASAALFG